MSPEQLAAAQRIARRIAERYSLLYRKDASDLAQAGLLALWRRRDRYDSARAPWRVFARLWLTQGIRREGAYLAQAATLAQNPKLVRMVDAERATKAHRLLVEHLKTLDPADALKGRILALLGSISAVLILVFVVVVYVLVQRGFV